jgi:outer membrane immunogenic protein
MGWVMKKRLFIAAVAALVATPALAADMLLKKAPPQPRPPAWTWTGFYVGANFGGGWAKSDWFEDVSGSGRGRPAWISGCLGPRLGRLGRRPDRF